MLKLQVCIIGAIAFLLMVLSGCAGESSSAAQNNGNDSGNQSAPVIFTDDEQAALDAVENDRFFEFLGKTYHEESIQKQMKSKRENRDVLNDPDWDEEKITKLTINHFIVSQSFVSAGLVSDNLLRNINSQIENGYYAIIPRNPYTGEDIKTSLEYSPGDFFFAMNDKAVVSLQHLGLMDSNFFLELDGYDNLYPIHALGANENFLTDGRTEYMYYKYCEGMYEQYINELKKQGKRKYGSRYPCESTQLHWLKRQMFEILSRYSEEFEDVLPTLEDYLNYFGRKNPAAWINPYTGKPMEQREQFAVCKNIPGEVTDLLNRPVLYFKVSEPAYVNHYAGNYSFAVVEGKKGPKAVFVIYFLNRENKLEALSCYANPNSNHNRAVHESRKKEK